MLCPGHACPSHSCMCHFLQYSCTHCGVQNQLSPTTRALPIPCVSRESCVPVLSAATTVSTVSAVSTLPHGGLKPPREPKDPPESLKTPREPKDTPESLKTSRFLTCYTYSIKTGGQGEACGPLLRPPLVSPSASLKHVITK